MDARGKPEDSVKPQRLKCRDRLAALQVG
jgi:hypothetical protein